VVPAEWNRHFIVQTLRCHTRESGYDTSRDSYQRKTALTPSLQNPPTARWHIDLRHSFHGRKPINNWFTDLEKFAPKPAISKGSVGQTGISVDIGCAFVLSKVRVNALDLPTPAQAEKAGLNMLELIERPREVRRRHSNPNSVRYGRRNLNAK
jgi:hypothetical protein